MRLKTGMKRKSNSKKSIKIIEELENEILEKGFNIATVQKMQQLKYNLLKLDKAAFKQEKIQKEIYTESAKFDTKTGKEFIKKLFYNQTEILNRQSLPLQKNYKKKVQEYFSNSKENKKND